MMFFVWFCFGSLVAMVMKVVARFCFGCCGVFLLCCGFRCVVFIVVSVVAKITEKTKKNKKRQKKQKE